MSTPEMLNVNRPRLVLAGKLTEAEISARLAERFPSTQPAIYAAQRESAIAAVAAGIAMHTAPAEADSASQILAHDPLEFCTGTCGKGRACDCDTEYRAAVEFAEQVDEDERMGSDLQVGIWCLLGFAAIGALAVLFL